MSARAICLCAWLALLSGCEGRGAPWSPRQGAAFLAVQEDPEPAAEPAAGPEEPEPAAEPPAAAPDEPEPAVESSAAAPDESEPAAESSAEVPAAPAPAAEANAPAGGEASSSAEEPGSSVEESSAAETPPGLVPAPPAPVVAESPAAAEGAGTASAPAAAGQQAPAGSANAADAANAVDDAPVELEHMKVDIIFEGLNYNKMQDEQKQYLNENMVNEFVKLLSIPATSIIDEDGVPGSVTIGAGSVVVSARIDLPAGMEVRTARRQLEGEQALMDFETVANRMPGVETVIEAPIDVEVEVRSVHIDAPTEAPEEEEEAAPAEEAVPAQQHGRGENGDSREMDEVTVEAERSERQEQALPPPPSGPQTDPETDFGPLEEETGIADLISAIEVLAARQEQAEEDREPIEKSVMRIVHVTTHLYGGLVVILVPTICFALWLLIAFIVAYFFKATRLYPEVELTKRDDDLSQWQSTLFQCCADPHVFWWSYCCPCVRWADNMGTTGAVKNYWVGWTVFMLLLIMNGLLSHVGWAIACLVLAFFRGKFRAAFEMEDATSPKTFMGDCCLYFFCWPCAISQEARQVDYACSAGHKCLQGEAGDQLRAILSESAPVKGTFALKQP